LLGTIVLASEEKWQQFFATIEVLKLSGTRAEFRLNSSSLNVVPAPPIVDFVLSARALDWADDAEVSAANLAASLAALVLGLLPLDDPDLDELLDGTKAFAVEGARTQGWANRYERSRSNRALAIIAHGTACAVCGFNFATQFGSYGEGYVEIHHLTPVHLMEAERVVNPIEELVPLCANCHRMVHRVDPPISPEALKEIVEAHVGPLG
jgi:predicted HNH restriction endonuclease